KIPAASLPMSGSHTLCRTTRLSSRNTSPSGIWEFWGQTPNYCLIQGQTLIPMTLGFSAVSRFCEFGVCPQNSLPSCSKTNLPFRHNRFRLHQLADCFEHNTELSIVPLLHLF